ncbi:MAG: Type II secretion system protein [Candidatus Amesbacteria bacterium GW2011_GWC1_46_24]|nr:MAG: Type II secretion system protein [Candidatus Amesbacteria bacterium GW2011_GWC1_46_24]
MKYRYKARDFSGQLVKGIAEGSSAGAVSRTLMERKLVPITISETKQVFNTEIFTGAFRGSGVSEMANFTRQLATMLTAGLPLTDALNLLKVQSSAGLAAVTSQILNDVQSGVALSTAMGKHPNMFSKIYVALVKAGESAGVMETVLNRLAEGLEKSRDFRMKVKGAMIYPIIILIGMVLVMAVMMIVVVPKMKMLYADFGAELPWSTKVVMGISGFMATYWWLVVIGTAAIFFGLRAFINTPGGRYKWDTLFFKLPITGPLARNMMLTEMARTLSLLVGSGVSVVEAIIIVSETVGNAPVEKDMRRIAKQVEKGFPISISFSESEMFPPIVGQMIAVGEETGKLDEVLSKLAGYYETESEQKIKGLTTAIEPIILMILAVGVGFLM